LCKLLATEYQSFLGRKKSSIDEKTNEKAGKPWKANFKLGKKGFF